MTARSFSQGTLANSNKDQSQYTNASPSEDTLARLSAKCAKACKDLEEFRQRPFLSHYYEELENFAEEIYQEYLDAKRQHSESGPSPKKG